VPVDLVSDFLHVANPMSCGGLRFLSVADFTVDVAIVTSLLKKHAGESPQLGFTGMTVPGEY
jgi:hypothetical protein